MLICPIMGHVNIRIIGDSMTPIRIIGVNPPIIGGLQEVR